MKIATQTFLSFKKVALIQDAQPFSFFIINEAEPHTGDIYCAKITKKTNFGYFLDIQGEGFLNPVTDSLCEGDFIKAQVQIESRGEKCPTFKFISKHPRQNTGKIEAAPSIESVFKTIYPDLNAAKWETEFDDILNECFQNTLQTYKSTLSIERTRACVCIDVDTVINPQEANAALASTIAQQIILRNISGNIIIDFAGKKTYGEVKKCIASMQSIFQNDYTKCPILSITTGGLVEIRRNRFGKSLSDCAEILQIWNLFESILKNKSNRIEVEAAPALYRIINEKYTPQWTEIVRKTGGAAKLTIKEEGKCND